MAVAAIVDDADPHNHSHDTYNDTSVREATNADNDSPHSAFEHVLATYRSLSHSQLALFLKVRSLPTTGSHADLASRLAYHDLHTYHFPAPIPAPPPTPPPHIHPVKRAVAPDLPVEIIAEILDHVGDWELARALGVPTSLSQPPEWVHASPTDYYLLTGGAIPPGYPECHPPTKIGALAAVRFSHTPVLQQLLAVQPALFRSAFSDGIIPLKASRYGRVAVLSWWAAACAAQPDFVPRAPARTVADALDSASRHGHAAVLAWWAASGLQLHYTEAALEGASARGHLSVLAWWKASGLPLKIGRAVDAASTAGQVGVLAWWAASGLPFTYDKHALLHASCHGRVDVLRWWLGSGLQLVFDQDVLTGATRHDRAEVLEWWDRSALGVQYRMCDVEEALEEAIGGGERARAWWRKKGVDFKAGDREWMMLKSLN